MSFGGSGVSIGGGDGFLGPKKMLNQIPKRHRWILGCPAGT